MQSKLPNVGLTIFSKMSALAKQHNAINLSQGFPDFGCDDNLLHCVADAMKNGHNQYAPTNGYPELLQIIANSINERYERDCESTEQVTITSGATEALFDALACIIHPGDEVIIFEPYYDSYYAAIVLNGGIPISIPLILPNYEYDWAWVKSKINSKTKAIMINSPHNPTGTTISKNDILELIKITEGKEIYIISDEVYENIIFDQNRHESIHYYPELYDRSFIINSFGKSLHVTGWKLGYCTSSPKLMKEFRKVHQYVTFSSATPLQVGIANYLKNDSVKLYQQTRELFEKKRNIFQKNMKESRFVPVDCVGTYFQCYDYSTISALDDIAFCDWLVEEKKVAAIPLSVFYSNPKEYHHKLVRFCFAKKDETITQAAEILCKL